MPTQGIEHQNVSAFGFSPAFSGVDGREYRGVRLGPLLRDSRRRRVRRRADLEQLDGLDPGLEAARGDAANAPGSE